MKKTIKRQFSGKTAVCFFGVTLFLILSGCSGPFSGGGGAETATLTINLGGGGGRAAYPPDDETLSRLSYVAVLTGPSTITAGPTAPGARTLSVTVAPGRWNITVTAYLDNEVYAEGSSSAEVRPGQSSSVAITMQLTGGPVLTGTVTITASAQPSLTGEYIMGQTLTANISNTNGTGGENWIWEADGVVIPGAASGVYTIADTDRGKTITVQVWYPDNSGSVTSAPVKIHAGKPVSGAFELIAIGIELDENYILTSDITVSSSFTTLPITGYFAGTFDGNGKTINFNNVSAGLFENNSGTIKNLKLTGKIIAGNIEYLGAAAGCNYGTIQNVSSSVEITRNDASSIYAGGIAGTNMGTIKNCYSTGSIDVVVTGGTPMDFSFAGGIAGNNGAAGNDDNEEILYCWANGEITNTNGNPYSNCAAGGIVGQAYSNISNCVALNNAVFASDDVNSIQKVGRIWGDGTPTTAAKNYGLDGMDIGLAANNTTNGQDGGDVSANDAATQVWWTGTAGWTINPAGGGSEASPWVWGSGQPKLWFE